MRILRGLALKICRWGGRRTPTFAVSNRSWLLIYVEKNPPRLRTVSTIPDLWSLSVTWLSRFRPRMDPDQLQQLQRRQWLRSGPSCAILVTSVLIESSIIRVQSMQMSTCSLTTSSKYPEERPYTLPQLGLVSHQRINELCRRSCTTRDTVISI